MEIWHYTGIDSCIEILKSQELWLSRFIDTNDGTDCDWSRTILTDHFYPILKGNITRQTKRRLMSKYGNVDVIIRKEVQKRLDILFTTLVNRGVESSFDHYMFCSSERCKRNGDDGILSMWRGYGKKRPAALVFNSKKLEQFVLTKHRHDKGHMILFEPVVYAKNHEDLSSLKKHLDIVQKVFEKEDFNARADLPESGAKDLLESVMTLAFAVKHMGFSEEREQRLTISIPDPYKDHANADFKQIAKDAPVTLSADKKRIYHLNFERELFNCLIKIVVGPRMETEAERIKKTLKSVNQSIPIIASTIPFLEK